MNQRINLSAFLLLFTITIIGFSPISAQEDSSMLSLDRIYSNEFRMDYFGQVRWIEDGKRYTTLEYSEDFERARDIVAYETVTGNRKILVKAKELIPEGEENPLGISNYIWSNDKSKLMIFTNTRRVWRRNTKGDYWVLNLKSGKLQQVGKDKPEASLMFCKFSPDDNRVAYVSEHNIFVEDLKSGAVIQLTYNGSDKLINGTFDWAYEEEFGCRDGFRWSPDGKNIAFWQVDASNIRNFLMLNTTDSIYSYTIPVQYPKVGEDPSSCRIGVIAANGGTAIWMDIPGDHIQNYLPRMMWGEDSKNVLVQQLNRKQNNIKLWLCDKSTGKATKIHEEKDEAWIDAVSPDDWLWLNKGAEFTWTSEKDGWRNVYLLSKSGKKTSMVSPGNFDVVSIQEIDAKGGWCYFIASPDNPTQRYLYRMPLYKKGKAVRLSPKKESGSHSYQIAPGGKYAFHSYSNINTPPMRELVSLPNHKRVRLITDNADYREKFDQLAKTPTEFFKVKTADGVEMDGFMMKPPNFDATKKYPVLFYVYGEPAGQTARDSWNGNLWHQMMAQKGYIIITLDNRGTPSPKGREWRKSIYRKIGVLNPHDQAMAAEEILRWDFIDPNRISVWGWSGGGSMTLNLLFKYPDIYKTGISVAPVSNQLLYDNIYQERYMGVPWENKEDFVNGSPITHAKNLEGNLLLVHGTGDDNVHYQNAEALINELIKHNKLFQVMPYPNRSHGIWEGENTRRHLYTMMTDYITKHVPPGGKTKITTP